jgi:NAD(P) transhydrogenase subunit alpha
MDDEVIRGTTVIKDGSITWPPPPPKLPAAPGREAGREADAAPAAKGHGHGEREPMSARHARDRVRGRRAAVPGSSATYAPPAFLQHFTVFVLACFVGYMVVWNVTPALHTPLMSVTNAISSIIAIGALVQVAPPLEDFGPRASRRRGSSARGRGIALTAINMFGGFAVTQRMLQMFRK